MYMLPAVLEISVQQYVQVSMGVMKQLVLKGAASTLIGSIFVSSLRFIYLYETYFSPVSRGSYTCPQRSYVYAVV